jgi:hypothetical protein
MKHKAPLFAAFLVVLVVGLFMNHRRAERAEAARQLREDARAQVDSWAEQLDAQTTETGVYVRYPDETLPELDPWGTPLTVMYSQGGFAERLVVRSAGPDGKLHTSDDIVAQRHAVNLKGVGHGVKENVEEVAEKAARGGAKGVITGLREGAREVTRREREEK